MDVYEFIFFKIKLAEVSEKIIRRRRSVTSQVIQCFLFHSVRNIMHSQFFYRFNFSSSEKSTHCVCISKTQPEIALYMFCFGQNTTKEELARQRNVYKMQLSIWILRFPSPSSKKLFKCYITYKRDAITKSTTTPFLYCPYSFSVLISSLLCSDLIPFMS